LLNSGWLHASLLRYAALQVYDAFVAMVSRIIAEPEVKAAVNVIIAEGTHNVLSDADVLQHGKEFIADGGYRLLRTKQTRTCACTKCNYLYCIPIIPMGRRKHTARQGVHR
jgi:hypothetical protein